ncbi:type IV toxin-antitoxin system AbiEi family antitoxin domain-containing protein [Mesorhizobium sp. B2-4-9]|uniref:type IV toxin-antitoxin system AbiEi family antitoxin domain-containing protein n=1 Tax=Mesorhizobium sp. B2-4-9 TaxID=2589940 RepID=UPI0032B119BB
MASRTRDAKRDRDRTEALRLAGDRVASLRDRAVELARNSGQVRTGDLTGAGIPRCYLSPMCKEGLLVKISYGRYRAALPVLYRPPEGLSGRTPTNCALASRQMESPRPETSLRLTQPSIAACRRGIPSGMRAVRMAQTSCRAK